jgi:dolichol-phosphate mannosyltransferase
MERYTVIVPTYNESKSIELIIREIKKVVPTIRILVVDDNSPDGTHHIVESLAKADPSIRLLLREKKEGLGKAYINAFTELRKDPTVEKIIMMDADFSHDPKYLPKLIDASKKAELVIGSRYIAGGDTQGWEKWRKLLSTFANFYCRVITRMNINDSTGGFNLITLRHLDDALLQKIHLSGYAFQMELKYLLWKKGLRIVEIPILFKNRREGESKMSNHIIIEGVFAPWRMILKK